MHHTVDKITSKPSDYKVCKKCQKLNWYENKRCIECDNNAFTNLGSDEVHRKMVELLDDFEMCMNLEIDI